jgi:hypothetical protein
MSRKGKRTASALQFFKVPAQLDLDLAKAKADWATWAMVRAISEAWFRNGHHQNHTNSFPLALCDTGKWGINNRTQRGRALKFLIKVGWIQVDRKNPQKPWIIMTRPDAFK